MLLLCCTQIACNTDIQAVWAFWDQKKMFDQWQGILRKLYMSAAALVAGWVGALQRLLAGLHSGSGQPLALDMMMNM